MVSDQTLKALNEERVTLIKKQMATIDKAISEMISSCHDLNEVAVVIRSVKGVGPILLLTLLAELPELGSIDRCRLAALVGVAPYANDSGKRSSARSIAGGRAAVRNTLYMAALAARKHCAPLKAFYQRLIAKGKKPKVAIVAIMRRLLGILNAIVRKRTKWDENYAQT